jgi:hypothetical protein
MPDNALLTFIPLIWLAAAAYAAAACKLASRADARCSLLMRTLSTSSLTIERAQPSPAQVCPVDEQLGEVTTITITPAIEAGELR